MFTWGSGSIGPGRVPRKNGWRGRGAGGMLGGLELMDAILIGGGHNGLTAAALLAKQGRRVVVLEQRNVLGGLAAGEEFHPGYHTTGLLHDTSLVRQRVIDMLELGQHGLLRRRARTPVFAPEEDGRGLVLHADPERARDEIAAHSARDAEQYRAFRAFLGAVGDYVRRLLDEPPPELAPATAKQYWALWKKGFALRRLGRQTMFECLRVGPMSVADWLGEHFESDLLKAALAAPALLGTFSGPRSAGTASLCLMHECAAGPELDGGPAALVSALEKACLEHGVELRTGARVRRILVEQGRAAGVELDGGESVRAGVVLSSVDPRQTFLELIAPPDLPPGLDVPMRNWRCRGTTAVVDLALDGPLEFAGRPGEAFESVRVCAGLDQLEQAFDPVKYRALPDVPHLDVRVPTVVEPGLCPAGHHVASILVHFVPYDLDGGWTDAARDRLLRTTIARLASVAPSCPDRIVGHRIRSPLDIERELGTTGGHVHHGEHALDQLFSLRPHVHCARHATPLPGLFLCGSGTHPGGNITCGPGGTVIDTGASSGKLA